MVCEGGGFSVEKPPPSRSLSKRRVGNGTGEEAASLREAPPPQTPLSRRAAGVWRGTFLRSWFRLRVGAVPCCLVVVTAADRAAVTTTPKQENAPTSHGRTTPKESTSLFPATLRERGSGGEALLLEKRPLPQRLPTVNLFGRKREGGGFSIREAPSLAYLFLHSLLSRPADRGGS